MFCAWQHIMTHTYSLRASHNLNNSLPVSMASNHAPACHHFHAEHQVEFCNNPCDTHVMRRCYVMLTNPCSAIGG